ncbi:hypothetical protein EYF80_041418 [Liparis tanakae]|uniref:Uncharacterized protein n=1 Tax=Liparis tanakae TaxID=230148 RepID=A0A4Z2G5H6_9TELE|nr:hypothetical protein EYF80_041418 [Liparis tanakae]
MDDHIAGRLESHSVVVLGDLHAVKRLRLGGERQDVILNLRHAKRARTRETGWLSSTPLKYEGYLKPQIVSRMLCLIEPPVLFRRACACACACLIMAECAPGDV